MSQKTMFACNELLLLQVSIFCMFLPRVLSCFVLIWPSTKVKDTNVVYTQFVFLSIVLFDWCLCQFGSDCCHFAVPLVGRRALSCATEFANSRKTSKGSIVHVCQFEWPSCVNDDVSFTMGWDCYCCLRCTRNRPYHYKPDGITRYVPSCMCLS